MRYGIGYTPGFPLLLLLTVRHDELWNEVHVVVAVLAEGVKKGLGRLLPAIELFEEVLQGQAANNEIRSGEDRYRRVNDAQLRFTAAVESLPSGLRSSTHRQVERGALATIVAVAVEVQHLIGQHADVQQRIIAGAPR